jgi:hypothetical protein
MPQRCAHRSATDVDSCFGTAALPAAFAGGRNNGGYMMEEDRSPAIKRSL